MKHSDFWADINARLDRIEAEKPDTYEGIAEIFPPQPGVSSSGAFFGGSGGDRTLKSALYRAGWINVWYEAGYHYCLSHPDTGEKITYVEGDIYPGDTREERSRVAMIDRDKPVLTGIDEAIVSYLGESDLIEAGEMAIAILDRLIQIADAPEGFFEQAAGDITLKSLLGAEMRMYRKEMEG